MTDCSSEPIDSESLSLTRCSLRCMGAGVRPGSQSREIAVFGTDARSPDRQAGSIPVPYLPCPASQGGGN